MKEAMKPRPAFVYDDELPDTINTGAIPIPFGDPPGTKGHDQYLTIVVKLQTRNTIGGDSKYAAPILSAGLDSEEMT